MILEMCWDGLGTLSFGLSHCSDATRIFLGCQYGLVYGFGYGLMINEGVHILHSSIMLIGTLLGIQR
jgi:hypothetical protein